MKQSFRLVLSSACAFLALLSFYAYGQSVREEAQMQRNEILERYGGEIIQVVVPTRTLEAGQTITASDISELEWLVDLTPSDAITSAEDVVGLTLSVAAAQGVPLTALNFRTGSEAAEVPSGKVALSIPLNDKTGISTDVALGSMLAAYSVGDKGTYLLAGNLNVLSIPAPTSVLNSASRITLAVAPEDVPNILEASATGALRLVLPADDVISLSQGDVVAPATVPEQDGHEEGDEVDAAPNTDDASQITQEKLTSETQQEVPSDTDEVA